MKNWEEISECLDQEIDSQRRLARFRVDAIYAQEGLAMVIRFLVAEEACTRPILNAWLPTRFSALGDGERIEIAECREDGPELVFWYVQRLLAARYFVCNLANSEIFSFPRRAKKEALFEWLLLTQWPHWQSERILDAALHCDLAGLAAEPPIHLLPANVLIERKLIPTLMELQKQMHCHFGKN